MRPPEVSLASVQRKQMSHPEVLRWQRLRSTVSGLRFRKQHPIGPYVVDSHLATMRLVIEVHGEIHARAGALAHDRERDSFLRDNGYRLVRMRAADVMQDADGVAASIAALAARPLHQPVAGPPPHAGEDQGS